MLERVLPGSPEAQAYERQRELTMKLDAPPLSPIPTGYVPRVGGSSTHRELMLEAFAPFHGPTTPPAGRKDDSGKLDMNLLDDMPLALAALVEVMQWAITKKAPVPYVRGSWQAVPADRYRAAQARHRRSANEQAMVPGALASRFQRDAETRLLHLAHEACSMLMALETTLREMRAPKEPV